MIEDIKCRLQRAELLSLLTYAHAPDFIAEKTRHVCDLAHALGEIQGWEALAGLRHFMRAKDWCARAEKRGHVGGHQADVVLCHFDAPHLRGEMLDLSEQIHEAAQEIADTLTWGRELERALDELLAGRDAMIRAVVVGVRRKGAQDV